MRKCLVLHGRLTALIRPNFSRESCDAQYAHPAEKLWAWTELFQGPRERVLDSRLEQRTGMVWFGTVRHSSKAGAPYMYIHQKRAPQQLLAINDYGVP
jgi:hypothetical protein